MSNSSEHTGYTQVIQRAFQGLDDEAINMLRKFAEKKTFPVNHVICAEGDVADAFYVIMKGRVAVTRDLRDTDEDFVMGFLGPGQYFGEMGLITDQTRAATVTTLVDTEVLEITKAEFEQVFKASPAMARNLLGTLINIIRETDQRAIKDLEERNAKLAAAYEELEKAQADRIARAALEAQLEVAARAQRSLLPSALPDTVPGFRFAAQFEPARHIGGDFYDVQVLENGQVALVLADVSDKGPHAALFMAVARTLFLTESQHYGDPVRVAQAVHASLVTASRYDMFVTAIFGVLDPKSRTLRYVRAGHDEPLYVKHNGEAEFLKARGRFLGLWPSPPPVMEESSITLEPGDCLVLYSDGVTDMRSPKNESFGRERLAELTAKLRTYDAERIARSIYNAVQAHRGPVEAFDDFTLLVLRAEQ